MSNAQNIQFQEEFWPAFWRATLLKLDILAIFVAISVVVYMTVSWIASPSKHHEAQALPAVKTQYQAAIAKREPQSIPKPQVRPVPQRPVAERIRADQRGGWNTTPAVRPQVQAQIQAQPSRPIYGKNVAKPSAKAAEYSVKSVKTAVKPSLNSKKVVSKNAVKSKSTTRAVADAKRDSDKSRRN